MVLTLYVRKGKRFCSDDTNVCFTYLKFDMLQSLPTDVYMLSSLLLYKTVYTVYMSCITDVADDLAENTHLLNKTTLLLSNTVYSTVTRDWIHTNT